MSNTRETLKNFLNLSQDTAGQSSISFSHDLPPGDTLQLNDQEDIKSDPQSGKTLLDLDSGNPEGMLGDYLSFLTREAEHVFPIKEGNEPAPTSERGDYLAISSDHGAEKVFIVSGTEEATNFNRYSNSQFQDLQSLIDKVAYENNPDKGHKALSNIDGTGLSAYGEVTNEAGVSYRDGDQNVITQAVQNDVLSKSRFGNIPNKPIYKESNENSETFESKDNIQINNSFGKHINASKIVKLEQLKSLGASLILKSSGFEDGINPGESLNPAGIENLITSNGENLQGAGSSILTSTDKKISVDLNRSKNAFGFPRSEGSDESIRAGRGEFITDDRESYGTSYNSAMHFSGKNHKVHKIQAALAITLVKELGKQIYDSVIKEYVSSEEVASISHQIEEAVTSQMNMILGVSSAYQNFNIEEITNRLTNLQIQKIASVLFTPTRYPYSKCIDRGLKVLFDDSIGLEKTLGASIGSEEVEKIRKSYGVSSSPGFWLAVSKSILKSSRETLDQLDLLTQADSDIEKLENFKNFLETSNVVRFLNMLATVGDASFQAFSGEDITIDNFIKRPRNVDNLKDSPSTRVGKSRKQNGYHDKQLAWAQNDVPSVYLLPLNPLRASGRLDKIVSGPNPFTAMMGSRLADQTYFSKNMDGSNNRIPKEVVKRLENILDSEYVPFYFHDLRTNEIISFHAFLDQLSDTISPNFNSQNGYGRLDPVKIYEGTTRTVQVGFTVVATSKEDFDAMWYKINKFVTMLYPQWTKGTMVGYELDGGVTSKFIQPNTQVLGASPIVRMRIGDIIKSNYSRFNLARMFGIGDGDVNPIVESDAKSEIIRAVSNITNSISSQILNIIKDISITLIALVYGSPIQAFNFGMVKEFAAKSNAASKLVAAGSEVVTNLLVNGHVNPLILTTSIARQLSPDKSNNNDSLSRFLSNINKSVEGVGPDIGKNVYLRANYNEGYKIKSGDLKGKRMLIQKPIKVKLNKKNSSDYEVEIVDFSLPADAFGLKLTVNPVDIYQTPNETLVNTLEFGILLAGAGGFIAPGADFLLNSNLAKGFANQNGLAPFGDLVRMLYTSNESNFMDPFNNPIVKAYESTSGRGLAGTIGSVQFDWLSDFPWEIDHNSRAPIGCKISFSFDVIHDIVPGLDHSGYNRAPLYNVGNIMKDVSGDVRESFFKEDEFEFRKASGSGLKIKGKN